MANGVIGDTLRAYANRCKDDRDRQLPLHLESRTVVQEQGISIYLFGNGTYWYVPGTDPYRNGIIIQTSTY